MTSYRVFSHTPRFLLTAVSRGPMMQYRRGYCKLEYRLRFFEGMLQLLWRSTMHVVAAAYPQSTLNSTPTWNLNIVVLCIQTSIALHQPTSTDTAFCTWPPVLRAQIFVDRCTVMKSECTINVTSFQYKWWLKVHSDLIAVHRSTSAVTGLSQQLCALRIFVRTMWEATQKTSISRRRPMQNDESLNAP